MHFKMFELIRNGDTKGAQAMLNMVPMESVNEAGQSFLHQAIVHGRKEITTLLLAQGIDVNAADGTGATPLHFCGVYRRADLAQELIAHHADVNRLDKYGNGPLWAAVFNARGDCSVVRLLVEHGADPNHVNNAGRSPIDMAKRLSDIELISLLEAAL